MRALDARQLLPSKLFEADPALRDFENIPLKVDVDEYFRREVLPHVPDAWMDRTKDKVGYEVNFNRHFYRHQLPRPLEQIDEDLKKAEAEILRLLTEVMRLHPHNIAQKTIVMVEHFNAVMHRHLPRLPPGGGPPYDGPLIVRSPPPSNQVTEQSLRFATTDGEICTTDKPVRGGGVRRPSRAIRAPSAAPGADTGALLGAPNLRELSRT